MGKRAAAEETKSEILQVMEPELATQNQHPYAFHVSGPRNVPSINWRDLISSNWSVFIFPFFCPLGFEIFGTVLWGKVNFAEVSGFSSLYEHRFLTFVWNSWFLT